MTADELAAVVGTAAAHELESALSRIKHCLGQLNDEQVWWRSQPNLNSIGNLILHLCGNGSWPASAVLPTFAIVPPSLLNVGRSRKWNW